MTINESMDVGVEISRCLMLVGIYGTVIFYAALEHVDSDIHIRRRIDSPDVAVIPKRLNRLGRRSVICRPLVCCSVRPMGRRVDKRIRCRSHAEKKHSDERQ